MTKTVLSYSGTGVQGNPMAHAFAAAGFNTRTITRDPSKDAAQALAGAGIDVRQGDLADKDALTAAHDGVDIVALLVPFFVQPPNTPMAYLQNALDAAKTANVQHLIWNPSGSITEERLGNPTVDFRHDMLDVIRATGIPYTVVAPGAYMENLMGPWTADLIREKDEVTYPLAEGKAIGWITANDVGAFIAEAAKHPELAGEIIRVNGPEHLSGPQMAERFTEGLGRQISWRALTPQQFGDQLAAVMGPEAGAGIAHVYTFLMANHDNVMPYYDMAPVTEKLPMQLTPLADWVRNHAFAFRSSQPTPSGN
jgi:uncharacterized protein YbjT (DUF2867 family)